MKRKAIEPKLSQLIHSIKRYHILENWIIVPIRTRVLRTWIGWIPTFGNLGVVLAKFVWGYEIPTTILTLNTNCSWSIMTHRLKPEKRLLQAILWTLGDMVGNWHQEVFIFYFRKCPLLLILAVILKVSGDFWTPTVVGSWSLMITVCLIKDIGPLLAKATLTVESDARFMC